MLFRNVSKSQKKASKNLRRTPHLATGQMRRNFARLSMVKRMLALMELARPTIENPEDQ